MVQGNTTTGAELFVDALEQYGVSRLFGNPGTTELPAIKALGESDLEYVLGLHEDIAVGMAAGYASTLRYHADRSDELLPLGVVNLHVAPGLAHGIGNIHGADFTGAPVVITAGNHSTDFQHEEPILSGELEGMVESMTKWSAEVKDVDALPTMLRRAIRVALTPPTGPVFLGLPIDVMLAETDASPERLGAIPNAGSGDPLQIEAAARALADAEESVIILGDHVAHGGRDAVDAAVRLAEASGARVHGEFLSAEVPFPSTHEQWVSFAPSDETALRELMDTDAIAFVGCSTHTTELSHERSLTPSDAVHIHVGHDAWELGKNMPADVAVLGDPELAMDAIAADLEPRASEAELRSRRERVAEAKTRFQADSDQTNPEQSGEMASKGAFIDAIQRTAPNAYLVHEAVTTGRFLRSQWAFDAEQMIGNKSGGLGYGLPATVGAALGTRDIGDSRDVIGIVGDGSYMYYPQTLYTAARYNVDCTIAVPNNRAYRILKDNTLRIFGGDESDYEFVGMDFEPPFDIPKTAESVGAAGRRVDDSESIEPVLEEALSESGPTVVDVPVHD